MAGLLLHGLDRWQGTLTAYNVGTGVLPAQRGKGVAGTRQCLLEVIQANEAAAKSIAGGLC